MQIAIEKIIENQWNVKTRKMDWLKMEQVLREILDHYQAEKLSAEKTVILVDECLAAFTRRGNVLEVVK